MRSPVGGLILMQPAELGRHRNGDTHRSERDRDTLTTTVDGKAKPTSSPTAYTVTETHTIMLDATDQRRGRCDATFSCSNRSFVLSRRYATGSARCWAPSNSTVLARRRRAIHLQASSAVDG